MKTPLISIVIPTHNSEKTVGKCLSALFSQTLDKEKYEVIVVDDSSDGTPFVAGKFPVKLIRKKKISITKARNVGIENSRGEIIVFTDSDCIPERKWLEKIAKFFSDKELHGLAGTMETYNKESDLARFIGYEKEYRFRKMDNPGNSFFLGTFNCACRKDVFKKIRFNEKIEVPGIEDTLFGFEVGKSFKIIFSRSIKVFHVNPTSLLTYFRKQYSKAYWHFLILKKYAKETMKYRYVDVATILQIPLTLFLIPSLFDPFLSFLFFASTLLCNVSFLQYIRERENTKFLFKSIVFIIVRNIAWLLGCLRGLFHSISRKKYVDRLLK